MSDGAQTCEQALVEDFLEVPFTDVLEREVRSQQNPLAVLEQSKGYLPGSVWDRWTDSWMCLF